LFSNSLSPITSRTRISKMQLGFTSPGISELEHPFENPLYFKLPGTRSSKLLALTLCHHNPRILEPGFAEMLKRTSSISFTFHDFGTFDVECSAPSRNPNKYSIATSDFGLSSLLSPDHPSLGLPKPQTPKF
jgi:hypothetical protein